MTSSAQYRIELISAGSESGESGMVRGTSSSFGKMRRHKYYRPRQRLPESCKGWKRLGVSICIFILVLLFLWIFVLSMMTGELFKRTLDLQRMTKRISAATDLLPEEMQTYQSMSKYMQKNQTTFNSQLITVSRKVANVTSQLAKVDKIIHNIEEKFRIFPDMINVPSQVVALSSSVAGLGSEVEDMRSSLARFRDEEDGRRQSVNVIKSNFQTLSNDIVELNRTLTSKAEYLGDNRKVDFNLSSIDERILQTIDPKLSELNESLSRRLRYTLEDQEKDHKMIVDLQEALENISSQVISLRQNTEERKADFNNLELKILEIRMQVKAMVTPIPPELMTTISSTTETTASLSEDSETVFNRKDLQTPGVVLTSSGNTSAAASTTPAASLLTTTVNKN